jgi:hypothetical protein
MPFTSIDQGQAAQVVVPPAGGNWWLWATGGLVVGVVDQAVATAPIGSCVIKQSRWLEIEGMCALTNKTTESDFGPW